jgi:hypothetical protein
MSKSNCTTIRRELDEVTLGEDCSAEALQHLSECSQCREFNQKQTRLRQIVRSLGTVSAPPDFDFRLRSRLAAENANSSGRIATNFWVLGQRSVAVATALMVLVAALAALVLVRHLANRNRGTSVISEQKNTPGELVPILSKTPDQLAKREDGPMQTAVTVGTVSRPPKYRLNSREFRLKRATIAEDFSGERAPIVRVPNSLTPNDAIFPVDASQQSLKVSLFDGRGNPRTISLPTVTFGSQRVLANTNSLSAKGVW